MQFQLRMALRFSRFLGVWGGFALRICCSGEQFIRDVVGVVPAADRDAVADPLADRVLRKLHRPFFFAGLAKGLPMSLRPRSHDIMGVEVADGYPTGRVGIYSNTTDAYFGWYRVVNDAESMPLADRWRMAQADYGDHRSYIDPASDRLMLDISRTNGGYSGKNLPTYLEGLRLDRFQATFSLERGTTTASAIRFVFNGQDLYQFDSIKILHESITVARDGEERRDGKPVRSVTETWSTIGSSPPGTDPLWFRVTCDGSAITIEVIVGGSEPTSWASATQVYSSSDFDMTGGMLGFMATYKYYELAVDNLKVHSDRDANGSYETLEHADDFTLDSSGYADAEPTYDASGNLTYDGRFAYTYDAWNRLARIAKAYRDPSTNNVTLGSTVMQASYDGLGRRTVKQVQNSADLNATYHYYYHGQSVVEERNGSDLVLRQYLWANLAGGYVDELVQVALNEDPIDPAEQDCERIYYAMQDANFNVLGIVDDTGTLIERYEYTPYGQRMVYFSSGSADPQAMTPTLISQRVEHGVSNTPQPFGINPIGHQGLMHDEASSLIYNRARILHPRLGRFLQRDPLGYVDGMNVYAAYHIMHEGKDPWGLYDIEWEGEWTEEQKKKVLDSFGRVKERARKLLDQLDEFEEEMSCCAKDKMQDDLNGLRRRLKGIIDGITSTENLELRHRDLGIPNVEAETFPGGYYFPVSYYDAQTTYNDKTRGVPWDKKTPQGFDQMNIHELAHVEEHWEDNQDGTGHLYDPHVIDDLIKVDLADHPFAQYKKMNAEKGCEE